MISIASLEQTRAGGNADAAALKLGNEIVSRVLDCAEFHHWEGNGPGARTAYFILRKALPGLPRGAVISLAELHAKLFPAKR